MIDPASSQVVPGSAIAWSAFLAGLQLSGVATRGVLSSQPSGTPLSAANRLRWNARLVSTAHSLVLVVGSCFCFHDALTFNGTGYRGTDFIEGFSYWPDFFARVFLGYLLYDLVIMLAFRSLKDPSGTVHHVIFVLVTAYVLHNSIFKFPFTWLSLCEASTPFVNYRWHLAVQGKKETRAYVVNGAALCVSFVLIRVVAYGAGLAHLWTLRRYWAAPSVPVLRRVLFGLLLAGWLLNCYWMVLIGKGTVRALRRKPQAARH